MTSTETAAYLMLLRLPARRRDRGKVKIPVADRLARKLVIMDTGCIEWTGSKNDKGYGTFYDGLGSSVMAHRWSYENLVGPIPAGRYLDHLCRNRACVNPSHPEPVTQRENLLRGSTIPAANATKTHCPSGHPYSGGNLYTPPGTNSRLCRACAYARNRSVRLSKKAA